MGGNQKSFNIEAHKDRYGRVVYNRHDLYEMLYDGKDISSVNSVDWHEDFSKYNDAIALNHLTNSLYTAIQTISGEVDEFDTHNQQNWFMPDKYKELDVVAYILDRPLSDSEINRVEEELVAFHERGMFDLLRYMIYLVDAMRENNIVWGVGRGSSVASYVLYIIGIHRINSMQYKLDWREFLR